MARFSEYFANAPVVEVGGRTFPVTVEYRGQSEDADNALIEVLEEIDVKPLGKARDALVFFSYMSNNILMAHEHRISWPLKKCTRYLGARPKVAWYINDRVLFPGSCGQATG